MTPSSRSSSPWSQAQSSFYRRSPSSSASRSPGNSAMRGRGVICRRSASLVQYHRVLAAHGWPRRHSWQASASSPWPDTRWAHAIGATYSSPSPHSATEQCSAQPARVSRPARRRGRELPQDPEAEPPLQWAATHARTRHPRSGICATDPNV
jgi:hypothetical protein